VGQVGDASGVKIAIDEAQVLGDHALRAVAKALGDEPLTLALHGGEDYALVVANDEPLEGFRRIGEVHPERRLVLRSVQSEREIEPEELEHFRWAKGVRGEARVTSG
jgi:thiamine-monophosphate kinase